MIKWISALFACIVLMSVTNTVSATQSSESVAEAGIVSVSREPMGINNTNTVEIGTHEGEVISSEQTALYGGYYKGVQLGDADMDGELTIRDVTTMQKYIADATELDSLAIHNADVDFDNIVTIDDASILQSSIAEIY